MRASQHRKTAYVIQDMLNKASHMYTRRQIVTGAYLSLQCRQAVVLLESFAKSLACLRLPLSRLPSVSCDFMLLVTMIT